LIDSNEYGSLFAGSKLLFDLQRRLAKASKAPVR